MQHIVSIDDCSDDFIQEVFRKARYYRAARDRSQAVHSWANVGLTLRNRLLISDFYQPSTRTRLSFEAAMTYLGGHVIGTENAAEFSSAKKGESIPDNFRVISSYCDMIVGRFKHEGEARIAADASRVPLINGGDGKGEHPTQAMIDEFIIRDKLWQRNQLTITFMGDNERSRTVRSLSKRLKRDPNIRQNFLKAPVWKVDPYWQIHHGYKDENTLTRPPRIIHAVERQRVLEESDIVYITRDQVEHDEDKPAVPVELLVAPFVFTKWCADVLPKHALILHPLPRNSELPVEIDNDPRAHYFEQAANGLFIRMALLDLLGN